MKNFILLITILFSAQATFAQRNIDLYWDSSYSLKDRDLQNELQYLNNYFKKYPETNVNLVMFSNEVILNEKFTVKEGNWTTLRKELSNAIYDGATYYDIVKSSNADEILLFTDGNENLNELISSNSVPITIVSTSVYTNTKKLKLVSDLASGSFVYLNKDLRSANDKEKSEQISDDVLDGFVEGNITGIEGGLGNVSIINKNSNEGTASLSNGNYKIKADNGDLLVYTFLGKKTVNVRVSKANIINVFMPDIEQDLDEVVVISKAADVEEELVYIGNQFVDKKTLGYGVETIDKDDISELDTNLAGAVKGQFTSFELPNDTYDKVDISQFLGRGKNMTILLNQYGLIVMDGMPLGQSGSEFGGIRYSQDDIINPDMIESITYLKGLAATNRFGTLGRNGVLLITTKNATAQKATTEKEIVLGTTATYTGNAEMVSELPNTPYINALKTSKSIDEAFNIYLVQRSKFGEDATFFLDTYDYFKGWNNELLSQRILSNVYEIAYDNDVALKALYFKQQEYGDYAAAVKTLERIAKLQPNASQSFRNLALAYSYNGQYDKALKLYDNIDKKIGVGTINTLGIDKTITNEAKNLIALHASKLNLNSINPKFLRPLKYKSRIVFEWNDLDAEFDLNIINPQNRFFTWSHTRAENSQRIAQQKELGYGLEEFYLTSSDTGEWIFNMKYYGTNAKEKLPTYIKITVYKNYGSPDQTKKISVVRLEKTNVEETVSKLVVN
jgi:tetratricopeptide (TPR) repeat protein